MRVRDGDVSRRRGRGGERARDGRSPSLPLTVIRRTVGTGQVHPVKVSADEMPRADITKHRLRRRRVGDAIAPASRVDRDVVGPAVAKKIDRDSRGAASLRQRALEIGWRECWR